MRAGVYSGKRSISVEDVAEPAVASDQVMLEVGACGICGSDLHAYREAWAPLGAVMGHEYAGRVARVGDRVRHVAVGDRVAVVAAVACGACRYCRMDRENLCSAPVIGAGGYAERVVIPADAHLYKMPSEMQMDEAAFLEPLSVAVRAVRLAEHPPEEPAIVVGLGTIGQGVVQVLKADGVEQVIGLDLSPLRRDTAGRLGADTVIDPSAGDPVAVLQELIGGGRHRGYSFTNARTVFECSGAAAVVGAAVTGLVRPAGRLVMVALFEADVSLDFNPLVRKEVTIIGSYTYTAADIRQAFELLRTGKVDVRGLISHHRPLARINEAFAIQSDASESVKVVIVPGSAVR